MGFSLVSFGTILTIYTNIFCIKAKIAQRAKNVLVHFKSLADDNEALAIIKDISPIALQHINLFETFEFC